MVGKIGGGMTVPLINPLCHERAFSQAMTTFEYLIYKSPLISKSVLIEAIRKEYDLPAVLLTSILQSNPIAAEK